MIILAFIASLAIDHLMMRPASPEYLHRTMAVCPNPCEVEKIQELSNTQTRPITYRDLGQLKRACETHESSIKEQQTQMIQKITGSRSSHATATTPLSQPSAKQIIDSTNHFYEFLRIFLVLACFVQAASLLILAGNHFFMDLVSVNPLKLYRNKGYF